MVMCMSSYKPHPVSNRRVCLQLSRCLSGAKHASVYCSYLNDFLNSLGKQLTKAEKDQTQTKICVRKQRPIGDDIAL